MTGAVAGASLSGQIWPLTASRGRSHERASDRLKEIAARPEMRAAPLIAEDAGALRRRVLNADDIPAAVTARAKHLMLDAVGIALRLDDATTSRIAR